MAASRILFISGTDTGVGKTVLTVLLVRHLLRHGSTVLALKPIASGGRGDALALHEAQQRKVPMDQINPWHFRACLAPPLAARREGCRIRLTPVLEHLLTCAKPSHSLVIVEGAGGLLSPLGEDFDSRDLILALRATPILVASNRLGAVHQVRAALAALPAGVRRRSVVVLSNPPRADAASRLNRELLSEFEPRIKLVVLPWVSRWREAAASWTRPVRESLEAVRRLAGLCGAREAGAKG